MITDKRILIIGGTGSLGYALTRRLVGDNELFILSRDETKQWMMQNQFHIDNIGYSICDIRNLSGLRKSLLEIQPDIVINASAMKQVPVCEKFPTESIKTNISGIENLLDVCLYDHRPDVVLGISTDKACKPVNVYGMCKAIGERLYTSVGMKMTTPKILCVRYGNVLESRGSIIPFYKYYAKTDKVYPLTHPEMTRFFLSLDESVRLVEVALERGISGDTIVPIIRSGRIRDLAELFIEHYGGKVKEVGIRSGEKIHEELINEEELRRTSKLGDEYLVIQPMGWPSQVSKVGMSSYTSDLCLMSKSELREYLETNKIFEKDFKTYDESEVRF